MLIKKVKAFVKIKIMEPTRVLYTRLNLHQTHQIQLFAHWKPSKLSAGGKDTRESHPGSTDTNRPVLVQHFDVRCMLKTPEPHHSCHSLWQRLTKLEATTTHPLSRILYTRKTTMAPGPWPKQWPTQWVFAVARPEITSTIIYPHQNHTVW